MFQVIRQREDFWRVRTSKEGSCLDRLDFTPISNSTTSGHTRTRKPLKKTDVRGWHSEFVHVGRGSHVHAFTHHSFEARYRAPCARTGLLAAWPLCAVKKRRPESGNRQQVQKEVHSTHRKVGETICRRNTPAEHLPATAPSPRQPNAHRSLISSRTMLQKTMPSSNLSDPEASQGGS